MTKSDRILVANLVKLAGWRPRICFEEVRLGLCAGHHSEDLVLWYHRFPRSHDEAHHGFVLSDKKSRAMSKSINATAVFVKLLNGHRAAQHLDHHLPRIAMGNEVVVVDETFSESQINTHNWNLFLSTSFHFPHGETGYQSTQHLQISYSNLKLNDATFDEGGIGDFYHVELLSGVCTFNGDILKASVSNSNKRVDATKLNCTGPTFHEVEYIARSSSVIADIAAALISSRQAFNSETTVSITLDVPSFHYYHSAVRIFQSGFCSAEETLQWMAAVDLRHDQIAAVFSRAVQYELSERGVSPLNYTIHVTPKITAAALAIQQSLKERKVPLLEDVLQRLDEGADGLWREFYQYVVPKERPKDLEDLGYLFYVFEVVKPALRDRDFTVYSPPRAKNSAAKKPQEKPRCLIVSVDDPAERRIYSRSQEMFRKMRSSSHAISPTLVEVYICRRVFVNGNKTRARLYHEDPMPDTPFLYSSMESGKKGVQVVEPLDLVHRLYGSERAQNLRSWFVSAGMQV